MPPASCHRSRRAEFIRPGNMAGPWVARSPRACAMTARHPNASPSNPPPASAPSVPCVGPTIACSSTGPSTCCSIPRPCAGPQNRCISTNAAVSRLHRRRAPEAPANRLRIATPRQQLVDHVDRQREDDGGTLLPGDFGKRLQVAQLDRARVAPEQAGGLDQRCRGLLLAFGVDDLGATQALGLGLARDRADHDLVEVDALDLDVGDLDAPGIGLRVEDGADVVVELLALGQHLVQVVLPQHRAKRGLRELAGGFVEVFDVDDRFLRIDHAEVHDGIDLHRDVVARDHILGRHIHDDGAQVDTHHLLHDGNQQDQARPLHLPESPQLEHHAAFVFAQDLDRTEEDGGEQYDRGQVEDDVHGALRQGHWSSGTTSSTRPSIAWTRTDCPRRTGDSDTACQTSPRIRTWPRPWKSLVAMARCPTSSCMPVTTGSLRARAASQIRAMNPSALATAMPRINCPGTPNPGTSVSNRISDPATSATRPPMPSEPKLGMANSAAIRATPNTSSATPA